MCVWGGLNLQHFRDIGCNGIPFTTLRAEQYLLSYVLPAQEYPISCGLQSRDELGAAGLGENTRCGNTCGYHNNPLWSAQEDPLRRVIFVEVQCEVFLKDLSG